MGFVRGMFWKATAISIAAASLSVPAIVRGDQATPTYQDTTKTTSTLADLARRAAEGGTVDTPDTVASAPIGIRFSPSYLNLISGDVNSIGMKNAFQTTMLTPFGSTFNFYVSADERHYRLQDKFDENKQLSASVLHVFNLFTSGSIGFLDSRVFNRSVIPGGGFQDYVFNDQSVTASGLYKRTHRPHSTPLRLLRFDATATGAAVQGERTYKNDQTLAAGGFGGVSTELRSRFLRIDARGGRRETWDRSETSLAEFDGLGSREDSLSTGLLTELGDSIFVDAKYVYYDATRSWADQAQGSLGGQQGGAQNVFEETETRSARGTVIALRAKVWNQLRLTVTGNHDSQLNNYAVQTTRYSNTVTDGLKGSVLYTSPWRTVATISLENTETLRDLGPLSVSSYNDTRKRVSIGFRQRVSKTMSMDVSGSTMLTRSEYLDPVANPRDRDQVDNNVAVRIGSRLHPNLETSVSLSYLGSEIINIDQSQSENNRTRELYELRPAFIYTFSDRFLISQSYGVSIEHTDFTYTQANNFLDRNLIFTNKFDYRPTSRIALIFDYAYNFHDNGSYLPDEVTGNEELSVQGEDRRDRILLKLDYHVMSRAVKGPLPADPVLERDLWFFAEEQYSRFEDRELTSDTKRVTTDGQIKVGARGDYDFGNGRSLTFSMARVKRFSRFGSEAEKDFWDISSAFNYPF